MNTQAQDALLRDQIVGSCSLVIRHIDGIVRDTSEIITMPHYKTTAEDALNRADRVIRLAARAISAAKAEMGKKQLETS
jgi:hypothetical protein